MCVSNASTALPNHILLATYCTQALELASRLAEEMQSATLAENLPKATQFSSALVSWISLGEDLSGTQLAWIWPRTRVQVPEMAQVAPLGGGAPFDQLQRDCSDGSSINHLALRLWRGIPAALPFKRGLLKLKRTAGKARSAEKRLQKTVKPAASAPGLAGRWLSASC